MTATAASETPGPAPVFSAGLAVADAARRIGVASSTLRTWERRYGIGPSRRTSGGHRRYTVGDIAALQRLRLLTGAGMPMASAVAATHDEDRAGNPADEASQSSPDQLRGRFAAAVARLDSGDAIRSAADLITQVGVTAAWTEVFVPHLVEAGQRWERTGRGVEREHLAAAAVRTALIQHTVQRPSRAANLQVLCAGTPGEHHTLPLEALAAALVDYDLDSCVLGTLPPIALHAATAALTPSVLVLWARSPETRDDALLRSLLDRVPLLCTAGPGWAPRRLPRTVIHLNDLATAVETVLAWTREQ